MQELLVDPLTGDRVILAPGRALRPDTFRVQHDPAPPTVADCPFCSGNEHDTPPEVARIGPGARDTPGWRVRVVPNKYPIVGDGVDGAHEVVVFSPSHNADLGRLTATAASEVFLALRDRSRFHLDRGCAYVQMFVNYGKATGASIEHPHAQLVALDLVPPRAQAIAELAGIVLDDTRRGYAVINGDAHAWCSQAAPTPFVTRVALAEPKSFFEEATNEEVVEFATTIHDTIERMQRVLGDPAYNVVMHTTPREWVGPFHWWADIVPRLGVAAGFELGTGMWVNTVAPDAAAAALRGE